MDKTAYRLKITLRDSRPPIWRSLLAPGGVTLGDLHRILQAVMGWSDSHLHRFVIGGEHYGIPDRWDWKVVHDERRVRLEDVLPGGETGFVYEYDFGDTWVHDVKVEGTAQGMRRPVCTGGERACPPEDVGGTWGYGDFLQAVGDPGHDDHARFIEWWGGPFDPERFDIEAINRRLANIEAA